MYDDPDGQRTENNDRNSSERAFGIFPVHNSGVGRTVADRENRDLLPPSGYSGCWLPSLPIPSGLLWGQTDHWLTNGRQYKLLANVAHASTACGAERSKRHAWPLLHDSGFGRVAPPVVHHILITWASMRLGRHRAHSCAQTVGDWAESLLYGAQLDTSLNVAMK